MSSLTRGFTMLAVACAATIGAGAASAQSVSGSIREANNGNSDIFARDRAVTVRERPRPEYEALGLPLGAFTVFPRAQLDFEYNDNVLATDTNEQSDLIFRFRPDVTIRSDWSTHAITAFARSSFVGYSDLSDESTVDWTVGTYGRLDVARGTTITAGVDYGRATEPRTVSTTQLLSKDPIRYDAGSAYIAAATVRNRLKLSARADYRDYNYDDGVTSTGAVVEQDDRDRKVASVTGRVEYGVSPATAVFFQATGNDRNYRNGVILGVPSRDSSGYEVLLGANFELGAVVRGEAAVGYIEQTFDDDAYQTISGFGARGELEWLPTQLTTVTLTGSRTIEDSGIIGSAGYLSTQVGVQVDHELLRNVILTGTLNYMKDDFDDIGRTDDRWGAGLAGTYLLNRRLGVTVTASHASRSSDGIGGQNYNVNRLMLTLVGQF